VTNDLRWCKVYLSVLQDYDSKRLRQGLKSCQPYLRGELARRLSLRYTPELTFVLDDSIAYGAHIAEVLGGLDLPPEDGPADGEEDPRG
jgi:ribosome-binding factor A